MYLQLCSSFEIGVSLSKNSVVSFSKLLKFSARVWCEQQRV